MKTSSELIEDFQEQRRLVGYHTAKGAYSYLLSAAVRLIFIGWGITFLFRAAGCSQDDTDSSKWNPSGLVPLTDAKTGVQYLRSSSGLTPRLDRDGKVMVQAAEKP